MVLSYGTWISRNANFTAHSLAHWAQISGAVGFFKVEDLLPGVLVDTVQWILTLL